MKIIRVLGERAELAISQHGYQISTFSDFGAEFFGIAHECENIVGQWRYYKKRKLLSSAGMIDSCFIVPSIMVSELRQSIAKSHNDEENWENRLYFS